MNRCVESRTPALAIVVTLVGAFALASLPASAQTVQRNFPQKALRGKMAFTGPPDVLLDGNAAHLTPGSRIHGQNNMLVMSGGLVGAKYVVDYALESAGNISEVWLLTEAEASKTPWPTSPEQAASWTFDALAQTWTKP
jgi:hypothetical protein